MRGSLPLSFLLPGRPFLLLLCDHGPDISVLVRLGIVDGLPEIYRLFSGRTLNFMSTKGDFVSPTTLEQNEQQGPVL